MPNVTIESAEISNTNHFIVKLSDGKQINLGKIKLASEKHNPIFMYNLIGLMGPPGPRGPQGPPGPPRHGIPN